MLSDKKIFDRYFDKVGLFGSDIVWNKACVDSGFDRSKPFLSSAPYFDTDWLDFSIASRFEYIADRYGDRLAVHDETTSFSYSEFSSRVRSLAAHINSCVATGCAVGILLPYNAYYGIALMAILTSGRVAVPLDPKLPSDRLKEIVATSAIHVMITGGNVAVNSVFAPDLLFIDIECRYQDVSRDFCPTVSADEPALVLYTSGSTGLPKGICNSHRALLQRVAEASNAYGVNTFDNFLLLSAPTTIAGCRETLTAVLNGTSLFITDVRDIGVSKILDIFYEKRISIVYIVPALLRALFNASEARRALSYMRVVRVGGDFILKSDFVLARNTLPPSCYFYSSFSSTEVPGVFQWFVPADWNDCALRIPLGYARPGVEFVVLNEQGSPAREGEIGELVVRSEYLALGLWKQGNVDPGPFLTDPNNQRLRVFRTGDLVKARGDGLWEMEGRKDRQIKINGVRVDVNEIEAIVRLVAHVKDVAVIVRRHGDSTPKLAAYVVPDGIQRADDLAVAVKDRLKRSLPKSALPSVIKIIEELPYLPGFKVDMSALQKIDNANLSDLKEEDDEDSEADRAPNSADVYFEDDDRKTYDAVKKAWSSVLGVDSFYLNRSWEYSDGDSLKALRLIYEIEHYLGISLPMDLIHDAVTAQSLAATILGRASSYGLRENNVGSETAPIIFIFPGISGDEPALAGFRTAFEGNVRFIIIEYIDWDEALKESYGFSAFVDHAFSQVTAHGSKSPFYLIGYSFGGFVALEVARRLKKAGAMIGLVGLIDSCRPEYANRTQSRRYRRLTSNGFGIGALRSLLGLMVYGRLDVPLRILASTLISRHGSFSFTLKHHLNDKLRYRALRGWQFAPVDVPVALYKSDNDWQSSRLDYGWQEICPDLKIIDVGGNHTSILEHPKRAIISAHLLNEVFSRTVFEEEGLR